MKLKDKVALVTGAAAPQGLRFAIVRAFANEGAKIAICDINEAAIKDRAKELGAKGTTIAGPSQRAGLNRGFRRAWPIAFGL
jgi:NAD(P)-dependent dehydrogenase (short-subunit alcohol dehydrogenase family)